MDVPRRHRAASPEKKTAPKITDAVKIRITETYEKRLIKEKRDDILLDLSEKYHKDPRTIERWIERSYKIRAKKLLGRTGLLSVEYEERQRFLALLQQWRSQVVFPSLSQLLTLSRYNKWHIDREREPTAETQDNEPDELTQLYLKAYERHGKTAPAPHRSSLPQAPLSVKSEIPFERLKKAYPDSGLWQEQASWEEKYSIYVDAFVSWIVEVSYATELLMVRTMVRDDGGDLDSEITGARRRIRHFSSETWGVLDLDYVWSWASYIASDILVFGIQKQSPHAYWAAELDSILLAKSLPFTIIPQVFVGSCDKVDAILVWEKVPPVKEKTVALLEALIKLQTTQNAVHHELNRLELRLSDQK